MKIKFPKPEEPEEDLMLDAIAYGDVFCFDPNLNPGSILYMKVFIEEELPGSNKVDTIRLADGKWEEHPGKTVVYLVKGAFIIEE